MGSSDGGATDAYSTRQRCLNIAGIVVFASLTVRATLEFVAIGREVGAPGWLASLAVLLALPLADFFSGLVHWAADSWGSADWPIIGGFVGPFRHHHVDPQAMTRHGFMRRFGDNVIAALPTFWFASLAEGSAAWRLFCGVLWVAVAWWVVATAQFHVWAHSPAPPRPVRWLQRAWLILPPEHHARHHRAPHRSHYCITTGWLDAPLRGLKFFPLLERLVTRLTGSRPHGLTESQDQPPQARLSRSKPT
jgi:ubiquitin-conjugating enzyme E2 variant